jgi:serine/threonine protein kinase
VVALKFVHGGRTASERDLNRFLAEVELVAAIDHPNIVRVYDTGDASGSPYLAMEYLPGGTLSERLRALKAVKKPQETKEPPMPPKFAAELVRKLALGVQAAHDRDIVHRDLKPSNVLFDANGEPRITDFGLAKKPGSELTMTNDIMGTPAYMAPEQARGGTKFVGPAADIYSLGVILYECVTGVRPYEDPDPIMLIRKVAEQTAPPIRAHIPSLNRNLELIVEKCLLKEPTERYETATDLADDLRRWLNNEPVSVNAQDPAAKWLIRFESTGRSLPVKNPERVIAGLRAGEWEAADEVRGPGDTDWLPIEDHPAFADAVSDLNPPRLEAPDETKLDMNPLIDVALVLLIFFILTTTYSSLKRSIDVPAEPDNEKGKVAQKIRPEDLKDSAFAVSAWMDGNTVRFRIDDKVVEQGEVERAMTDQVRTTGRRQIILSVEGKVPWGAEAVIHDGAKGAGIQQIFRKKWKAGE